MIERLGTEKTRRFGKKAVGVKGKELKKKSHQRSTCAGPGRKRAGADLESHGLKRDYPIPDSWTRYCWGAVRGRRERERGVAPRGRL